MKKIFLLLVLMSTCVYAQKEVKVDLSNPHSTVYTHLHFLQPETYNPEKSAKTIYGLEAEEAEKVAIKIKKVLDGKGLLVNMNNIPRDPNYKDSISDFEMKNRFVPFPNKVPKIYVEKIDGSWYYSVETAQVIDKLYHEVYPKGTEFLKSIIPSIGHKKFLTIELWQYLGALILLLLGTLLFYILKMITFFILKKIEHGFIKVTNEGINQALKKLSRPISLLLVLWFIEKYVPILQFEVYINKYLLDGIEIARTIFWIYVFLTLVRVIMNIYGEFADKSTSKLDDQLVPILNSLLRGVVLFVGALKLLILLGVDATAVIAGASIGGLAVALASQDTVKNLIGTFMIFLDKPFHIGDWIEAGEVIGTVEEVGFRSTRVRGADTSIFQIPNSKLAEIVVNNKGLRLYRRYRTNLGLRYDTPPELIEAFVKGLRKLVEEHPETRSESYNVEFTGFGDSALLIMLNVYFKALEWGTEQSSKHRLHIAIIKLAKELGVDFAFPSSTVMIEQFPDKESFDMKYNTEQERIDNAIAKVISDFHK